MSINQSMEIILQETEACAQKYIEEVSDDLSSRVKETIQVK